MRTGNAVLLSLLIVLGVLAVLAAAGYAGYRLFSANAPASGSMPVDDDASRIAADVEADRLLGAHREPLEATARAKWDLRLEPMEQDDRAVSKVGGTAYWPEGRDYPRDSSGNPLALLAQVDFAEMEGEAAGYPRAGLLQFFIAADDHYGAGFDAPMSMRSLAQQRGFRVVYWPQLSPGAALAAVPLVPDSDSLPFRPDQPRRIHFVSGRETIGGNDAGLPAVLGGDLYELAASQARRRGLDEDALIDALYERLRRNGHKLGGHPDFTQSDPRDAGDEHVLLLQLDTDEAMMWGDSGIANFFIPVQDLARGDFSRVAYNWDCY